MRIFAIGDTHLSRAGNKPMHVFGEHWRDHEERIRDHWNAIGGDDDVLLIAGDVSWAMRLEEARIDLEFLSTFRGHKLLLKGNHDYWWSSLAKLRSVAPPDIDFLQNDARLYGRVAIAGTRGWTLPDGHADRAEDGRIFEREVERLRLSLSALRGLDFDELIVAMHYPPLRRLDQETAFSRLIEAAGAQVCVYGHLHGADILTAAQGESNGVRYKLVSADAVEFTPWPVWPAAS